MCRVLVVDRDQTTGTLLARTLGTYEVVTASSAQQALWDIKEFKPSLMFLSAEIMDFGDDILLRRLDRFRAVIVMTAGHLDDEVEADYLERGAAAVIRKPFSLRKVLALTNRLFALLELDKDLTEYSTRLVESTKKLRAAHLMLAHAV